MSFAYLLLYAFTVGIYKWVLAQAAWLMFLLSLPARRGCTHTPQSFSAWTSVGGAEQFHLCCLPQCPHPRLWRCGPAPWPITQTEHSPGMCALACSMASESVLLEQCTSSQQRTTCLRRWSILQWSSTTLPPSHHCTSTILESSQRAIRRASGDLLRTYPS